MLLIFSPVGDSIPMTVINVHNGKALMNIAYQGSLRDIEFVEQFNEHILIKSRGKPLKIHDILTNEVRNIDSFKSPDAFIFIYEKDLFVSLRDGRIIIWSIDGTMLTE